MVGAVLRGRDCAFLFIILSDHWPLFCRLFSKLSKQAACSLFMLKPKFQLLAPSIALCKTHADTQQTHWFAAPPPSIVEEFVETRQLWLCA